MGKTIVLCLLIVTVGLVWVASSTLRPARRPGAGPSPDRRPKVGSIDAWLLEAVRFYRQLGFIESDAGRTDEAIAAEIRLKLEHDWGDALPNADAASLELFLSESMPTRIWWRDTEADVFMGNRVYEEVLAEWARISAGAFTPENVAEHWDSERGPLRITFELAGEPRELRPEVRDDWLDMNIVAEINRMIEPAGRTFAMHLPDQSAVLMCVTPEERRALEEQRGWKFIR